MILTENSYESRNAPRIPKTSILIVDDERRMCESLKILFETEGYSIDIAETFREAMDCLENAKYDLIITDLILNQLSGFEVMDYVTVNCPETLIIAMTGHASLDSAIEAMRRGAYDYVVKPFNFDVMQLAVGRALDRIRLSRKVRQSEEKYQLLVDEINDGYFVLQDRRLVYLNKTFASMVDYRVEDLLGKDFTFLLDINNYPKLERIILDTSERTTQEELNLKTRKGSEIPVEVRIARAYIDDQLSLVGICHDISERQALWDKILRSEKLASLGGLIAGIAHELNNKLTPVLAYAELMEESDLGAKDRRRVDVIINSAESAKKIVESLLLFTRQEKPHKENIDINEVIICALNLLQYQFRNEKVGLRINLDTELPRLFADFHQMEQVFFNMAKNAFEAMEGQGGELEVRSSRVENNIVIEFADTGAGISSGHLSLIFDPFFTTKVEGKGTGLGLSLSHGIVQEHGGDITVSSIPGKTVFTVCLPLAVPITITGHNKEVLQIPDSRKTILVIDDEQSIALLLSELLEGRYDVARVFSGQEAVEAIAVQDFDLIISDIKMPGMDGMELFRWIESNKPGYKGKIVFTTGVVFDPQIQAFLKEAKTPCLTKPFKISSLLNAVETMLGTK